jgi:hypothetical protein
MTTKERNRIVLGILLAVAALTVWLFVGIYRDREWSDLHVFLKHRPSFKVSFYSPLGEADPSSIPGQEGYMSPREEIEEQAYTEFVEKHGGYKRSFCYPLPRY